MRIDAPFDGDFPDLVDEQIAVEIIDYRARARMFAEVLGAENVSLASFGTSRTSGGALLDDFLSRIGCDPAIGAGGLPAQNASNDVRSIHIWRRLLVEKGLAEASDDARRAALRTLKQLQRNLGWGEAKPVFFTPSARHALLARYVEGNAEVNAQYGTELIDAEALDGKDYPASNWPPVGLLSAGEISAVRDAFGLDLSDLLA